MLTSLRSLTPWAGEGLINVVVTATKGARLRYTYEEHSGFFALRETLPKGFSFPYDFGFIPGTVGDDGEPIDVLVLMEDPTMQGCLLRARPIGVVRVAKNGLRNDRIIAVWPDDVTYGHIAHFGDLPEQMALDIEHFFRLYPTLRGEMTEYFGWGDVDAARTLLNASPTPIFPQDDIPNS